MKKALLCLLCLFVAGFTPPQYGYRIIKTYPHDRTAFTQGFEFRDGVFYEGTGLVGPGTSAEADAMDAEDVERESVRVNKPAPKKDTAEVTR